MPSIWALFKWKSDMTPNLITLSDPRSPAAEAFQSLRTSLEFSAVGKELHTILLCAVDGEGEKSNVVANVAAAMAIAGDRVILVDGDLRKPHQHEIFGVAAGSGLAAWLPAGGEPPLQATGIEGLHLLAAGQAPANPVALLSAKRLAQRLAELAARANYVLIDAPPVLTVTDAALWASQADGVVLLIHAGRTTRENAQRAKSVLESVSAKLIGAVLLDADADALAKSY
jgi:non-specific protein-tyrosine kinase